MLLKRLDSIQTKALLDKERELRKNELKNAFGRLLTNASKRLTK